MIQSPIAAKQPAVPTPAMKVDLLTELENSYGELRDCMAQLSQLREASAHTGKWTLDVIAANWEEYRSATRRIARCWMEKVNCEQELLCPLLKR